LNYHVPLGRADSSREVAQDWLTCSTLLQFFSGFRALPMDSSKRTSTKPAGPTLVDVAWLLSVTGHVAEVNAAAATCSELWKQTQLWHSGVGVGTRTVDALLGPHGRTRLMFAAATGRLSRLQELVGYGADVNVVGGRGLTAMAAAVEGGFAPSVLPLLRSLGAREPGFRGIQSFSCKLPADEDNCVVALAAISGSLIASAHRDGRVHLWACAGPSAGQRLHTLSHTGLVVTLTALRGGALATASLDSPTDTAAVSFKIWNVDSSVSVAYQPSLTCGLVRDASKAVCMTGLSDGRLAAGGMFGLRAFIPSRESDRYLFGSDLLGGRASEFGLVTALAAVPGTSLLAAGNEHGRYAVIDLTAPASSMLRFLEARQNRPVRALVALPRNSSGQVLLIGGGGGIRRAGMGRFSFGSFLTLVDAETGSVVRQLSSTPQEASCLTVLPNGLVMGTSLNVDVVGGRGIFGFAPDSPDDDAFGSNASVDVQSISAIAGVEGNDAVQAQQGTNHVARVLTVLEDCGAGLFRVAVAVCEYKSYSSTESESEGSGVTGGASAASGDVAGIGPAMEVCIRVYR
jgi:hypothetical protein